jgi:hypothetical protein
MTTGALDGTDPFCRFQTIHAWHAHVHQHDIEVIGAGKAQRLNSTDCLRHEMAAAPQHLPCKLAVHLHIIDEQDAQGSIGRWRCLSVQAARHVEQRSSRHREPEHAAAAGVVTVTDLAAKAFHQASTNG